LSDVDNVNVAQATARFLHAAGIRRVYGVPGEDHLGFLSAVEEAGMQYVGAHEESAACIMAAAEAQATGLPGVAVVTIAPGLTNAINGIASGYLDNLPMLIVAGQHNPERYPVIVRQTLDNHTLVRGVTKWSLTASSRIHQILAKAFDTAMAPPAGPVFLELRDDVAKAKPSDKPADWPLLSAATVEMASASAEDVSTLRAALQQASYPVIIAGGRVRDPHAGQAIARLSAALKAPVFTSPAAKGLLPPGEHWLAGTFLNGNPEAPILEKADLVLAVGLDANDFFNGAWRFPGSVMAVEPDRTNAQHFLPVKSQLVGDVAAIVNALASAGPFGASAWQEADVSAYHDSLERQFPSSGDKLTIPSAIADARSILPPETLIAVDAGFGKPLNSFLWPAYEPNSCFSSQGLSTMGYALPAANALKLMHPERPVVGFMGDGSLLMRATEIGTAAELGIAPIYVTWVDATLSQIEIKQRRQGLRTVGVTFRAPQCAKIADAFGGRGWDVDTRAGFHDALCEAVSSSVPCLIGARIDQTSKDEWFELIRG
jgi:acetolactate synthase I/II/III large subunit